MHDQACCPAAARRRDRQVRFCLNDPIEREDNAGTFMRERTTIAGPEQRAPTHEIGAHWSRRRPVHAGKHRGPDSGTHAIADLAVGPSRCARLLTRE
jgi:hypothetical protein